MQIYSYIITFMCLLVTHRCTFTLWYLNFVVVQFKLKCTQIKYYCYFYY